MIRGILWYDAGQDRPAIDGEPLHCGEIVTVGGEPLRVELGPDGWVLLGPDGQPRPAWGRMAALGMGPG